MNDSIVTQADLAAHSSVHCTFECPRSQGLWHVRRATVQEGLARPYHIMLSLACEDLEIDPDKLVGATCSFSFESPTTLRNFHGVILRIRVRGLTILRGDRQALAVDVEVVPALSMLGQRINCRIFQDMTVPAILKDVLLGLQVPAGEPKEGLAAYERTVDAAPLGGDYEPPRDYCVQYKESDLDFVSRLMHEEGIVYVFTQSEDEHEVLKLVDSEGGLPALDSTNGAILSVDPEAVAHADTIKHFVIERSTSPTHLATRHYSWMSSVGEVHHKGTAATKGDVVPNDRELYLPSDHRGREIYTETEIKGEHDDSERRLMVALERLRAGDFVGRGSSNACGLGGGTIFVIDHDAVFERFVALEVVHQISMEGDTVDIAGSYENHFVCVPSSRFRLASGAAPAPVMHGPQTATVTGPENEDIHTDAFGRIKILMHWDREGQGRGRQRRADPSSSVWVRVVQAWAGDGWGALFIPRVGMEVLVEFLEGNPDRPIVTGCVYNGKHRPPYPLPEQRTRSTIRTQSTPGGNGSNELRFEDQSGREEVYIHCQKDFTIKTENDKNQWTGHDETLTIGNDRTKLVEHDQSETVKNDKTIMIEGNHTETIVKDMQLTVQGNRTVGIIKDHTETVSGHHSLTIEKTKTLHVMAESDETVDKDKTVHVGGSFSTTVDGATSMASELSTTITAQKDATVSTEKTYTLEAKDDINQHSGKKTNIAADDDLNIKTDKKGRITAADELVIKVGDAKIVMKKNGDIFINGKNIDIKGSGAVTAKGSTVDNN